MAPMPSLRSMRELYPKPMSLDLQELLKHIISFTATDGSITLRRALAKREKDELAARMGELRKWLQPAENTHKIAQDVSAMLMGFGGPSTTKDEAEMIVTQYVAALQGLPYWAVARACMRFASGMVTAEELGETLVRGFRPSTAQLAVVARKFIEPLTEEVAKVSAVIIARAELPLPDNSQTPEERAAYIKDSLIDFRGKMQSIDADAELEKIKRRQRECTIREAEQRVREYVDAGLDPPSGAFPASLPMMIKMGWKIKEIAAGKRVLVK
jgi:hypothetical protein